MELLVDDAQGDHGDSEGEAGDYLDELAHGPDVMEVELEHYQAGQDDAADAHHLLLPCEADDEKERGVERKHV